MELQLSVARAIPGEKSSFLSSSLFIVAIMKSIVLVFVVFVLAGVDACLAGNWPQWRGPHGTGLAEEGRYPAKFSAEENLLWKVPLRNYMLTMD